MHIVYKSKPMPIHIDEYEHNSFEYDKWIISDDYRELKFGYEYRIIVSRIESKAFHTSVNTTVLSLPPLKPIIQGILLSSSRYCSFISSIILFMRSDIL